MTDGKRLNARRGSFLECGVVQISTYMGLVELITFQNDRKWTAVAHGDLHMCAKYAGFYDWYLFAALCDYVLIQFLCERWISCLCEGRTVSFDAVCIESELGYKEQGSTYVL